MLSSCHVHFYINVINPRQWRADWGRGHGPGHPPYHYMNEDIHCKISIERQIWMDISYNSAHAMHRSVTRVQRKQAVIQEVEILHRVYMA